MKPPPPWWPIVLFTMELKKMWPNKVINVSFFTADAHTCSIKLPPNTEAANDS